jgi:hypothetical protein
VGYGPPYKPNVIPIVFGTNFDAGHRNPLSRWERAGVRGSDKEHHFLPLILTFSRREEGLIARRPQIVPNSIDVIRL